jgi:hypothetical protein
VHFLDEVSDEQIECAVAIHVRNADSHIACSLAHRIEGHSARDRFIAERAVPLIHPEPVRFAIIGDEDVGPAVAFEVRANHAESWPGENCQSACGGHIFKRHPGTLASAVVVKLGDGPRRKGLRPAIVVLAGFVEARAIRIVFDVVCHHQVEPAVPIVIEEAGRDGPQRILDP